MVSMVIAGVPGSVSQTYSTQQRSSKRHKLTMAALVQFSFFFLSYIYSAQQVRDTVFSMALQHPMAVERERERERGRERDREREREGWGRVGVRGGVR